MSTKAYYLDKRVLVSGEKTLQKYDDALNLKEYIQEVVDDSNTDFTSINVDTINESTAAHGVIVDGATIKDSTITLADGAVGNLSVKIGADANNGIYGVSDTQLGIAVEGTLVGGADTSGLFTGNIAEQVAAAGVTIDGVLCKDGGVSSGGGVYVAGFYLSTNGPQSITGPGAINLTSHATQITTTGADAFTLGNGGVNGQLKRITLVVDGGDATVTPTTAYFTTATFNDAGDTALFIYNTVGGWQCIENSGVTIA